MLSKTIIDAKWAICSIALVGLLAGSAAAFEPYGGQHYFSRCSPYSADFTRLYETRSIPTPPYFALHPPVYYSFPVARTYGYSPYAYPPQTRTPELALPVRAPKVIQNRFVPPLKDGVKKAVKDRVTISPVRISNPFVTEEETVAKR